MWRQLEQVFVVKRVLSCHCMRQLLVGNMKPGRAKPPDLSFGPERLNLGQTWLSVCWCIDNWDLLSVAVWRGDKGLWLDLVYPSMLVIQVPSVSSTKTALISIESKTGLNCTEVSWQWVTNAGGPFKSRDPKHVPLIIFFVLSSIRGKWAFAFMSVAEMFGLRNELREQSHFACGSFQTGQRCWHVRIEPDSLTPGPFNQGSCGEKNIFRYTLKAVHVCTFRCLCRHDLFFKRIQTWKNRERESRHAKAKKDK